MGGVAVLHPQDVLRDRLNFNRMPLISPPSTNSNNSNAKSNSNRRKRSPQKKSNDFSRSPPPKSSNLGHNINGRSRLPRSEPKGSTLVMGKVKILKRGEGLRNDEKAHKEVVVKGNRDLKLDENLEPIEMVLSRLGPEPEMVPKQIRLAADFYAGSAFDASPPPSSLPVPEFFFKKRTPEVDFPKKIDESSSDLCRLLKLAGIDISP